MIKTAITAMIATAVISATMATTLLMTGCDVKMSSKDKANWKQSQAAQDCYKQHSHNGKAYSKCLETVGINGKPMIETYNPYKTFEKGAK